MMACVFVVVRVCICLRMCVPYVTKMLAVVGWCLERTGSSDKKKMSFTKMMVESFLDCHCSGDSQLWSNVSEHLRRG